MLRAGNREVAGPGRQVEDALAWRDRGPRHQVALPRLVAAVRQQPRDQVVATGNGGEQAGVVAPLGIRRVAAKGAFLGLRPDDDGGKGLLLLLDGRPEVSANCGVTRKSETMLVLAQMRPLCR